jgi:uncharacterized protein YhdP
VKYFLLYKRQIFKFFKKIIYWVGLSVFVLHCLSWIMLKNIENSPEKLQAWISDQTGYQVQWQDFQYAWVRFLPEIHISQLKIFQSQQICANQCLTLDKVHIRWDPLFSLLQLKPKFEEIHISGISAYVEQLNESWVLAGFQSSDASLKNPSYHLYEFLKVFTAYQSLVIQKVNISIRGGEKLKIKGNLLADSLILMRKTSGYYLGVKGKWLSGYEVPFSGQIQLPLNLSSDGFQGRSYLNLPNIDLDSKWSDSLVFFPLVQEKLHLSGFKLNWVKGNSELWADWSKDQINQILVRPKISDLHFQLKAQPNIMFQLKQLSGVVGAQRIDKNIGSLSSWLDMATNQEKQNAGRSWLLFVQNLSVLSTNFSKGSLDRAQVTLRLNKTAQNDENWYFEAKSWPLEWLMGIKKFQNIYVDKIKIPFLQKWHQSLKQVSGDIETFSLSWSRSHQHQVKLDHWQLQLKNFAFQHTWSQGRGFDIHAHGELLKGQAKISSSRFDLSFPDYFAKQWQGQGLKGQVNWKKDPIYGWSVDTSGLHLALIEENKTVPVSAKIKLKHVGTPNSRISFNIQVKRAPISTVKTYLSSRWVPHGLEDWLKRSLKQGVVETAELYGTFPLAKTKKPQHHQFDIHGKYSNLVFSFHPDWPDATQLRGSFSWKNNAIDVNLKQGNFLGNSLTGARVKTSKPWAKNNDFLLTLASQAKAKNALAILQKTPLKMVLPRWVEPIQATGMIGLDLKLDLKNIPEHLSLGGFVNLKPQQASFASLPLDLSLENLNGELSVDFETMRPSKGRVQGLSFGRPIVLDVIKDDIPDQTTMKIQGGIAVESLYAVTKQPILYWLSGVWPYEMEWHWSTLGHKWHIYSQSQGLNSLLPPPFTKQDSDIFAFDLKIDWPRQGPIVSENRLKIENYPDIALNVQANEQGLENASLMIGEQLNQRMVSLTEKANKNGARLSIVGDLPKVQLQPWIDWIAAYQQVTDHSSINPYSSQALLRPNFFAKYPLMSDLNIDALVLGQVHLPAFHLDAQSSAKAWDLRMQAPWINAQVQMPSTYLDAKNSLTKPPIQVKIKRLDWQKSMLVSSDVSSDNPRYFDPRVLPSLNLELESLNIHDKAFGSFKIQAKKVEQGLSMAPVYWYGPSFSVAGNVLWRMQDLGVVSDYELSIVSPELSKSVQWLGYEKSIEGGPLQLVVKGQNPGSLLDATMANTKASGNLTVKGGRLVNVQKHSALATPLKVLGVLNIDYIQKRLRLDFSDVYQSGLAFDHMRSEFHLKNGRLTTPDFEFKGPLATFYIAGDTDLIQKTFDHEIKASVAVARNLILPAAYVAGIPGAATAYLVEKAIGDQLNKITTLKYKMTGTWQEPVVKPSGIVDTDFWFKPDDSNKALIDQAK